MALKLQPNDQVTFGGHKCSICFDLDTISMNLGIFHFGQYTVILLLGGCKHKYNFT